jgi:GT2 family glycosyltransferase
VNSSNTSSSDPALLTGITDQDPDISVIIVSWNAKKLLEECLDSLSRGIERSYEVIVVDNASTDGSPEMVAGKFPWVTLIASKDNNGFAKGNNIGINRSRGKYLALVNSDVNVLSGCLDKLAEFLDNHPDAGMVGPRVKYGDGRQQSSCRRFPSLWNNTCEILQLNRLFPRSPFFAGEHMFYFSYDRIREVDVLVGCFILARRAAVQEFGLLDEGFWMYGEDVDWGRRCWQAGWKVMFYPNAEAIHYCGGSSSNDPVRFEVAQLQAVLRLWGKHRSRAVQAAFWILKTLQCTLRLFAAGLWAIAAKRQDSVLRVRTQVACLRALWRNT